MRGWRATDESPLLVTAHLVHTVVGLEMPELLRAFEMAGTPPATLALSEVMPMPGDNKREWIVVQRSALQETSESMTRVAESAKKFEVIARSVAEHFGAEALDMQVRLKRWDEMLRNKARAA